MNSGTTDHLPDHGYAAGLRGVLMLPPIRRGLTVTSLSAGDRHCGLRHFAGYPLAAMDQHGGPVNVL